MDTSALIAKLHIAQSQAQQLVVGGPAKLTVPGISDPVSAKVSLISPALDPGSTTVEVWLRVENKKNTLKAGTPVHASIQGRTIKNALTVPREAVLTTPDGSSRYVMVIGSDSTAKKKTVAVGIQNSEDAQILSGIGTSDMVISTGGYGLDENTKVKIGTPPSGDSDEEKPAAGKADSGDKSSGKDADEK
jgi:RND family efflux transporter MFP subunit